MGNLLPGMTMKHDNKKTKTQEEWIDLLTNKFSIVLYGYGDKTDYIKDLIDERFANLFEPLLITSLNEKEVNSQIELHRTRNDRKGKMSLFILFNADSSARSTIYILENAYKKKEAVLIMTADNINAPIKISTKTLSRISAVWKLVVTNIPYSIQYEIVKGEGDIIKKLDGVLACISSNTKKIFQIILNLTDKTGRVKVQTIVDECYSKLLLSDKNTLKSHLTEFIDHSIVKLSRGKNGEEEIRFYNYNILKNHKI
eukprot:GHVP01047548.1.p1 GENE.GHVP01047548.1~~GHVP01047548.1.p1  ORF type:complete len:256 (+),score=42.01 GHVP01047548.1:36-803(+)